MSDYVVLGRILSHGYLEGYLPVQVAFPSLASMLLGQVDIPGNILITSIVDSLSIVECQLLKSCLGITDVKFSTGIQDKLIDLLNRFGSREIPCPSNLRSHLLQVSTYQFLTKPMSAHVLINSGICSEEKSFWSKMLIEDFYSLYRCLSGTPEHVLQLLQKPVFLNPSQERVFRYLRDLIGNFSTDNTRSFLRFVTGNSVLSLSYYSCVQLCVWVSPYSYCPYLCQQDWAVYQLHHIYGVCHRVYDSPFFYWMLGHGHHLIGFGCYMYSFIAVWYSLYLSFMDCSFWFLYCYCSLVLYKLTSKVH